MLQLKNMSFKPAGVEGVCLEVAQGEIIMLVGPNGSGKSSLLKCINGIHVPTGGSLDFLGASLIKIPLRARSQFIASMSQDPHLATFSELTVYENYLMAKRKKSPKTEAEEYLKAFNPNLPTKLDLPAGSLSGGERQALGLSLCLMHNPRLVLLDEHTSALDPKAAKTLMQITIETITNAGASAIICTHNLQDALDYGTRLIMMRQGKIALDLHSQEKRTLTKEQLLYAYTATD